MDETIQRLSATTRMKGIGTVERDFRNSIYTSTSIETTAYFIPEAYIRLFRRQGYFGENISASFVIDSTGTILTLTNQLALRFDYHKGNNLPMSTTIPFANSAMCMTFDAFTIQNVLDSLVEATNQTLHKHTRNLSNGLAI